MFFLGTSDDKKRIKIQRNCNPFGILLRKHARNFRLNLRKKTAWESQIPDSPRNRGKVEPIMRFTTAGLAGLILALCCQLALNASKAAIGDKPSWRLPQCWLFIHRRESEGDPVSLRPKPLLNGGLRCLHPAHVLVCTPRQGGRLLLPLVCVLECTE